MGKTFPALPAHAQPTILHIWQEAHCLKSVRSQAITEPVLIHYQLEPQEQILVKFETKFCHFHSGIGVWTWWRHQTFSALLAICAENSPVPGEFTAQRPVRRSFDVFFDLRLNKRLSKQWWGWWFETLLHPLWRHRNEISSAKWRQFKVRGKTYNKHNQKQTHHIAKCHIIEPHYSLNNTLWEMILYCHTSWYHNIITIY